MVLKATKVGQGDKTLLDIDSLMPVTEKMLEEAIIESFLDALDAGYVGDVHNVQWRASEDVSILFEDDDSGEETASINYFSASLSPPVDVSTPRARFTLSATMTVSSLGVCPQSQ